MDVIDEAKYGEIETAALQEIVARVVARYKRPRVKVSISNRHIHLSQEDLRLLFGESYKLTYTKELLPGEFACEETVSVIGRKGRFEKVRILAPVRKETQVEISLTDSFTLGIPVPVNASGNLKEAGVVVIENSRNGARIERACAIAALRHIHLSNGFASMYGFSDKQIVSVSFEGPRGLRFDNVLLRVSKDFIEMMHVDIDEANAAGIKNDDYVTIHTAI